MARRSETPEPGRLIPIDLVAMRAGVLPEVVWARLTPDQVQRDWDSAYCVDWGTAKALFDEITAANEEANRLNQQRIDRQMDEENEARRWPYTLWERTSRQNIIGTRVQVPGEGDEEPWAEDSP